ncbi:MAG: hypothetical protein JSV88_10900 [Candidatus Aminicenantes bacterium]|nr:MAG: hypothetical protein JSV88_10900 [Candidatus Aminicenantes bacterium]
MQIEKCIEEIENEIELINELIESHELLLNKVKTSTPDRIEISALATVLHSFYNGIENVFSRIANRLDKKQPSSEFWHQELLEQMKSGTPKRKAVISNELHGKLNLYLGFRHFFRHAYAFQFKWEKIKELVMDLPGVYTQFKQETNQFIKKLNLQIEK